MGLFVSSSSHWITEDVWPCLLSVLANYFTHPAIEVFAPCCDVTPLLSNTQVLKTFYLNTKYDGPPRPAQVDSVFFVRDATINDVELWGTYGRVAVVTDNPQLVTPLWVRSRLIDIVVLVPGPFGVDAFTWFPYAPSKCHRPVVLEKTAFCSKNQTWMTDLFPEKVPRSFSGCPVYYKTRPNSPDIIEDVPGVRSGREPAMMDVLAESLGLTAIYRPTTPEFYGWNYSIGTAMYLIRHGDIDFAFAMSVLLTGYNRLAEPLPVFRDQPVVWFIPTPRPKPASSGIYLGFSEAMWIRIVVILLISGVVAALLISVERKQWKYWYWLDFVAVVVTAPISNRPSVVLSAFMMLLQLYSMHIAWFYQSTLLFNLYNTPMESQLTSPYDASMAGLKFLFQEWMILYFNQSESEIYIWNRLLAPGNFEYIAPGEGLDRIVTEKAAFLLDNQPNIEWTMRKKYRKGISRLLYVTPFFTINPITVYGYRGSPLTKRYHVQMLRFIESGVFFHLSTMQGGYQDLPDKSVSHEPQVIKFQLLSNAFLLHACISLCAFIIFMAEIVSHAMFLSPGFAKFNFGFRKLNRALQLQHWLKWK